LSVSTYYLKLIDAKSTFHVESVARNADRMQLGIKNSYKKNFIDKTAENAILRYIHFKRDLDFYINWSKGCTFQTETYVAENMQRDSKNILHDETELNLCSLKI